MFTNIYPTFLLPLTNEKTLLAEWLRNPGWPEYFCSRCLLTEGMLCVMQRRWVRYTAHLHIYLCMASTIYPCGFPDDREKDPVQQ